jgi:hypothetical protein
MRARLSKLEVDGEDRRSSKKGWTGIKVKPSGHIETLLAEWKQVAHKIARGSCARGEEGMIFRVNCERLGRFCKA